MSIEPDHPNNELERIWMEQESATRLFATYLQAGALQLSKGHIERAVEYYGEATRIARNINDDFGVGAGLSSLGALYYKIGNMSQAKKYFGDALTIARRLEQPKIEGYLLFNISLTLDQLGKRDEAIIYAQKALSKLEKNNIVGSEKVRNQLAQWDAIPPQDRSEHE